MEKSGGNSQTTETSQEYDGESNNSNILLRERTIDKTSLARVKHNHHYSKLKKAPCLRWKYCCIFIPRRVLEDDMKMYFRGTMLELIFHLLFMLNFCILTFGSISIADNYLSKALQNLFMDTKISTNVDTTFRTSTSVADFWKYTNSVMLNGLYWENSTLEGWKVGSPNQGILDENVILGVPRLRQIRVKPTPCPIEHPVRFINATICYPNQGINYEDKGLYGNVNDSTTWTSWNYQTAEKLSGYSYWGKLGTYSAGGAYCLLSKNDSYQTRQKLNDLKQAFWIRRASRAVFLEFTVYNANTNLFCNVKLVWEFSASGGLVTTGNIKTVRLLPDLTLWNTIILIADIIFLVFTILLTAQTLVEMWTLGLITYCSDVWPIVDWLILGLSYTCIVYVIYKYVGVPQEVERLVRVENEFPNFDVLVFWESVYNNLKGFILVLGWGKLLKYMKVNRTMAKIATYVSSSAGIVSSFFVVFIVTFLGFGQLGFFIFGSQVHGFTTIQDSFFSLLRLIMGEFSFSELKNADPILGPIFFVSYAFIIVFLLINLLIAIVNKTNNLDLEENNDKSYLFDYLWQLVTCQNSKKFSRKSYHQRKGKISNVTLRVYLKKAGYLDDDIEEFIKSYEIKPANFNNNTEFDSWIERFDTGHDSLDRPQEPPQDSSPLEELSYLETTLTRKSGDSAELPKELHSLSNMDDRVSIIEAKLTVLLENLTLLVQRTRSRTITK